MRHQIDDAVDGGHAVVHALLHEQDDGEVVPGRRQFRRQRNRAAEGIACRIEFAVHAQCRAETVVDQRVVGFLRGEVAQHLQRLFVAVAAAQRGGEQALGLGVVGAVTQQRVGVFDRLLELLRLERVFDLDQAAIEFGIAGERDEAGRIGFATRIVHFILPIDCSR